MNPLARLADTLATARRGLTEDQLDGLACVHCARPIHPGEPSQPANWRGTRHQCADKCFIETTAELTPVFTTRISARRLPDIRWWPLDIDAHTAKLYADQPKARLAVTDGHTDFLTGPTPLELANRLARQARRLGFDANILKHHDEQETGR